MCLAVPMKVVAIQDEVLARCQVGESETFVTASTLLLPELPKPGEYVIVHAGFALRTIEPAEAEETLRLLREIAVLGEQEHWS